MHIHRVEDSKGDLVDIISFCSDYCHCDYATREGLDYEGWDGCHEASFDTVCANCETEIEGID